MASSYEKGFKKHHGCGVIRRTTGGSYIGEFNRDGKRRRKAFAKLSEAEKWLDDFGTARDKKGDVLTVLNAHQLQDALNAFLHLEKHGYRQTSLFTIAEAYTAKEDAITKAVESGTVRSWYDRYMLHLEKPQDGGDPARPRTITGKRQRLKSFLDTHGADDAAAITKNAVDDWLAWTKATGRHLLNYKTEIQSLFNFIEKNCDGYRNTVARFPQRKKKEVPPAEILTVKQATRLLHELEKIDPASALVIALGCFAGLRTAEIMDGPGLQWSAVDFEEGIIRVPASQTKARKARDVKITANLKSWLLRYRGEGRIAPAKNTYWKRKIIAAGKAKVELVDNGARHSFGTYYGRLHGYRNASEMMGHSGTMMIFEAHYKGTATDAEAREFFEIKPATRKGQIIKFPEVAA